MKVSKKGALLKNISFPDITEREKAEERLRLVESAIDASISAVGITDLNGEVIYVNPALVKMFGYDSPEEMLGKSASSLAKEAEDAQRITESLLAGRAEVAEVMVERRDGTEIIVELRASVVTDASGQPIGTTASLVDITERKQAEEELNVRAQLLDGATDSIWVHDFDGNFVYVNEAAYKSRGYTRDELMGMNLRDVVAPPYAERIESGNKRVVEKGGCTFEGTHLCKDGSLMQVESHARTIKWGDKDLIFSVVRDITERKRAEEELRESEEFSSSLLNNAPNPITVINPDTSIRYVNPALEELTGFPSAEVIGRKPPYPWWPEEKQQQHGRDFEEAMCQGTYSLERPFQRKNGEQFWVEITSTPVIHNEELRYFLANWVDITERKRLERLLQETNQQLEAQNEELQSQSEELKAQQQELMDKSSQLEEASRLKSEFLATMSHELRTPLNAIIGFSELMLDGVPGEINDEQRQCLNDIYSSGQHLLDLINDVLDLSRVESGKIKLKLESLDLAGVIKSVVQTVKPMLDDNRHELRTIIEEGLPQVRADRSRLRQILFNLLSNAIKFTPPGGKLGIEISRNGDWCRVSVADNGIGIREEDREQIFETFTQGETLPDRKREGTGLGLTLTRQFVELFGGKIWVESEHGKGSRFTFTLPLATAD